jgi:hypothetical protein
MTQRSLTITLQPDWKAAIRAVGVAAKADTYQGEVLNFETPAQFFGQLSEKRWDIVRAAQGKGEMSGVMGWCETVWRCGRSSETVCQLQWDSFPTTGCASYMAKLAQCPH